MTLIEQINNEIKNALREKDNVRKNVFKSIKASAASIAKENKIEITDEIVIKAIKKEIKMLDQTISTVEVGSPLYWDSITQKNLITDYLPKELTDEELTIIVRGILMALPRGSNFGMKMKACIQEIGSKADNKRIKQTIEKVENGQ